MKVDGISFFAGGPEDIAQSMGLPGEPLNPKVTKAYAAACSKVRSSGKFMLEDVSDMIDANDIIIKETAELLKKHGRTPSLQSRRERATARGNRRRENRT